jgi:hypothetical protein
VSPSTAVRMKLMIQAKSRRRYVRGKEMNYDDG